MIKYKFKKPARVRKSKVTPELQQKYEQNLTLAPIDICLKKGIVTDEMHKAANYFVYLYSLRFGSRHMISCAPAFRTNHCKIQTENWFDEKNQEYREIFELLKSLKSYEVILDICVYEKMPSFLKYAGSFAKVRSLFDEYNALISALKYLVAFLYNKHAW